MKYPSKNMRRSDKVQLKEQKTVTTTATVTPTISNNLLTNAAKMKITKAMANSKLQMNYKVNFLISQNNNNNLIENEQQPQQQQQQQRCLAQMLEKDSRTPILQYVTDHQQQQQQKLESQRTIDEEAEEKEKEEEEKAATATAIESLTQSLVQQQVNCIKETTTNKGAYKERSQVKVENSTPPLLHKTTTTSTTITTNSRTSGTPTASVNHENVVFQSIHDAYNQRSLEPPVSSKNSNTTQTTTTIIQPQTSTTTLMSSSSSPLPLPLPLSSSQNVLKSIPTQVVVENCSSTEGTGTSSTATATVTVTGGKFEVNSVQNFQTQNNRCSDVDVETRNNHNNNNNQQHHQQTSIVNNNDKELIQNLTNLSSKKTNTTTTNNDDNISVINNNNNNNNNLIYNNNVHKNVQEIELPNYRGVNNSVIITNYNYQRQQPQQDQQEQQSDQLQLEENKSRTLAETLLQRYTQQQKTIQQQQQIQIEQERKENQQQNTRGGDPNLNQASFQEQQQYLLNTYNNCIYDLSLQQHLQQQQQQQHQVELHIQQQNLTPYALHLQPLTQTLHFFDDIKTNHNNNNNNQNNNNNNSEESVTNMPGNLTLYTNFAHENHHHRHMHHLESSHASITHTPTSIDEVIQDTLKDECLDDNHGGGLSYCTLTAVSDLPGLRDTYYQQQLAHEQHLVQQHHLQQHHLQQQQQHSQPLLQQHLLALNHHHGHTDMHVNVSLANKGSVSDSPPPSALVPNNIGVNMSSHNELVTLNNFTNLANISNTQRDPYGNLTPDHTPSMYFSSSLSPELQCR